MFSADGRFLVSGSDRDFTVWDFIAQREIGWTSTPDAQFDGVAFSADGAHVMTLTSVAGCVCGPGLSRFRHELG